MKRSLFRAAALLCAVGLLFVTGCSARGDSEAPAEGEISAPDTVDPLDTAPADTSAADVSLAPTVDEPLAEPEEPDESVDVDGAYLVLDNIDAYEGAYSFYAEQAGTYSFAATNAAGHEDITWNIYALEEEFDDNLRYLSQAVEPVLSGDGEVELTAGSVVYCECSWNAFTDDGEETAGLSTLVVRFTPDVEPEEPETSGQAEQIVVDAADIFDGGSYSFQAQRDGTYQAASRTEEGTDLTTFGFEEGAVEWSFYVLDEPFEEAIRYLPQAYESALTGDGTFDVKAGEYVYCLCNVNANTAQELPEGVNTLTLTLT